MSLQFFNMNNVQKEMSGTGIEGKWLVLHEYGGTSVKKTPEDKQPSGSFIWGSAKILRRSLYMGVQFSVY